MNWEEMFATAVGALGLKPNEFWCLTMAEYNAMVKGYQWRNEREWERMAQLASWITAPHLKRPVSPEKLLGRKNGVVTQEDAEETLEELFDEL